MEHARDAEEAEEDVELAGGGLHAVGEVLVKSLGVETGDLVVLPAVVGDDFAAGVAIGGEVGGPGSDVGRVEGVGDGGVVDGEGRSVPAWVAVHDVSEPVLVSLGHQQRTGIVFGCWVPRSS